jgi:sugar phosphate isomerase/epimerase
MSIVVGESSRSPLNELASHHPIGMSTGVFADAREDWPELVAQASAISPYAIELSALSAPELPGLIEYMHSGPALPFRYLSAHAPTKSVEASDEVRVVEALMRLPLRVRAIVTHPDVLRDPDSYRLLGKRLVLENMDTRKNDGRTVEEMQTFFSALPEAGFCLDVAHAGDVDSSMELAHELLDRFRSRLRHVHLSSLDEGSHVPLTEDDAERFGHVLSRCRDVPWVLEARPPEKWRSALGAMEPPIDAPPPATEEMR